MKQSDEKLLAAVATEAERQLAGLNTQNLANTAWTFAEADLFQHVMGVCSGDAVGREAIKGGGRVQLAELCQHSMGVCSSEAAGALLGESDGSLCDIVGFVAT